MFEDLPEPNEVFQWGIHRTKSPRTAGKLRRRYNRMYWRLREGLAEDPEHYDFLREATLRRTAARLHRLSKSNGHVPIRPPRNYFSSALLNGGENVQPMTAFDLHAVREELRRRRTECQRLLLVARWSKREELEPLRKAEEFSDILEERYGTSL